MPAFLNKLLHGAERNRAYLYRLASGIAGLAVAGGALSQSREGVIVAIFGLILGVPNGLAAANTSTKKPGEAGAVDVTGVLVVLALVLAILWLVGVRFHVGG